MSTCGGAQIVPHVIELIKPSSSRGTMLAVLAAGCAGETGHGAALSSGYPVILAFAGQLHHETDHRAASTRHPACERQRHVDRVLDLTGANLTLDRAALMPDADPVADAYNKQDREVMSERD